MSIENIHLSFPQFDTILGILVVHHKICFEEERIILPTMGQFKILMYFHIQQHSRNSISNRSGSLWFGFTLHKNCTKSAFIAHFVRRTTQMSTMNLSSSSLSSFDQINDHSFTVSREKFFFRWRTDCRYTCWKCHRGKAESQKIEFVYSDFVSEPRNCFNSVPQWLE